MTTTPVKEAFIPKGEAQLFEVDRGQVMRLVQVQGGGQVADVLPFEEAADAHRRVEAGGLRGRIVLQP